jgi:N-acetylmuramoyl-L-alanine amidase
MLAALLVTGIVTARAAGAAAAVGTPRAYQGMLAGRVVIIDPGHGGYDPGAVGHGLREADINLDIAEKLKALLVEAGARVVMTWSTARPIPPDRKYKVEDRVQWIVQQHGTVLLDIHTNMGVGGRGPQVFYQDGVPSRVLADDIQEELSGFTNTHRQVSRINQYVLRESHLPAVNVEVGFLSNRREAGRLGTARYRADVAWCIFIGVLRWFVGGYRPPEYLPPPAPADLLRR